MEEIEIPLEDVQEKLHHQALHAGERWISQVALSSAILAVLAAITALLAGHHSNEAVLEQIRASDQWAFYQAKGIKAAVMGTKLDLLKGLGKPVSEEDLKKLGDYKKDQEEISTAAKEKEAEASLHFHHHVILARGVTLFQIAIAMAAISALIRRRRFWFVSLAFGAGGACFLIQGIIG